MTVSRPRSVKLSTDVSYPSGASITWSIAAAIRRPARLGDVDEDRAVIDRLVLLGLERSGERRGGARDRRPLRHLLVRDQLGLDDDRHRRLERLDLVQDRGDGALGERHEPGRA